LPVLLIRAGAKSKMSLQAVWPVEMAAIARTPGWMMSTMLAG
jgi:hypothetical protein